MSDAFDEAKNGILRGSKENGGLTQRNLFDLIVASHGQTMSAISELREVVGGRAEAIELAKREVMSDVEAREHWPVLDRALEKLCAEMDRREPKRQTDPPGEDWRDPSPLPDADKRTLTEALLSYSAAKWIVRGIIAALIVFGVSYGADSCSRHAYWGATPPEVVVTTTPTPTPTLQP